MGDKILELLSAISGLSKEIVYDRWYNITIVLRRINGDGFIVALYVIATLYILIKEKDMNKKCLMVIYPILLGLLLFCPLFYHIAEIFVQGTYFRLFWLFPMGVVIAYAFTDLIYTFSKKYAQFPIFLLSIVIVAICGKFIYTEENFEKTTNVYKIPEEAKQVIDFMAKDTTPEKKVLVPKEITPYVRQLDSTMHLYYGRDVTGMYNTWYMQVLSCGSFAEFFLTLERPDYIVAYNNVKPNVTMYEYGYHIRLQTANYDVYEYVE